MLRQTIRSPPTTNSFADPLMQNGWIELLRPEAFKAFTMVTDDDFGCWRLLNLPELSPEETAQDFDTWILETAPDYFGTASNRRYAWHSLVGVGLQGTDEPYEATEPVNDLQCSSAYAKGHMYQHLSVLTGGLRYPVCSFDSYDAVFQRIAQAVVEQAMVPCIWDLPDPPEGETFDKDFVNVNYLPSDGSGLVELGAFENASDCNDSEGWYYDDPDNPTSIVTCPETCRRLENDTGARVDVGLGCATRVMVIR